MSTVPEQPNPWSADTEVSIEELARRQGVQPIRSIDDLKRLTHPDVWESDDEFQEFLADLYASRRSDI